MVRRSCAAAAFAALCLASGAARGDVDANAPPVPPLTAAGAAVDPDAERLRAILDLAASNAGHGRMEGAIVDAVMAAAYAPIGGVLVARSDPAAEAMGTLLLVHGAVDLLDLTFLAFPSPMEYLRDEYEGRLARGLSPSVARAETERDWKVAIASAHRMSIANAVLDFVLGPAEAAFGVYLLLGKPGVGGWDRQRQTDWGAALVGVGIPGIAYGLHEVLGTSQPGYWWSVYERTRVAGPSRPSVSFSMAPAPRGAAAALVVSF